MKRNNALRAAVIVLILAIITGCFASRILARNAGLESGVLPYHFESAVRVSADPDGNRLIGGTLF